MKKIPYSEFVKWPEKLRKKDLFLDIGCWSGAKVLEMKNKCNFYGLDFDKEKLKLVDIKIKKRVKYGDITKKIPFDKKFDLILLSEVIEHIKEDELALKNISNSLKKNGILILTTPKSIKGFEFWDPAWIRWKMGGNERHHHYTLNELDKKLSKQGLKIQKYAIAGPLRWISARWINVFLKYVLRINKTVSFGQGNGICSWMIFAKKIK